MPTLFFVSCGDKDDPTPDKAPSEQDVAPKQGATIESVKQALKSQVNAVTADLMLKTPSFADLPPAEYNIPSTLEGREMVQVSVRWPFIAKYDLYKMDSVLADLDNKPVVVEKVYSKDEELDYVEVNFVLQANGGSGYLLQNSRQVKSGFSFEDVSKLEQLGEVTLIKGSDEHLEASREVATIKQVKADQLRKEKLEAKKAQAVQAQAKQEQLLTVLRAEGELKGISRRPSKETSAQITLKVSKVYEAGGESFVEVVIYETTSRGKKLDACTYEGAFSETGELGLLPIKKGRYDGYSGSSASAYLNSDSKLTLEWDGSVDRLKLLAHAVRDEFTANLIRK